MLMSSVCGDNSPCGMERIYRLMMINSPTYIFKKKKHLVSVKFKAPQCLFIEQNSCCRKDLKEFPFSVLIC